MTVAIGCMVAGITFLFFTVLIGGLDQSHCPNCFDRGWWVDRNGRQRPCECPKGKHQ